MGGAAGSDPRPERAEDLVAGYLREFEIAALNLPPGPREGAVRRVRRLLRDDLVHAEASADEVRRYLQDLGTPQELSSKAAGAQGGRGSSAGLAIGAVVFTALVWPVGVALLWYSRYWTRGEKLIGTLLVPGGAPAAFYLWPALARVGVGAVWSDVAQTILPLLCLGLAFYLVITFVLRVDDSALGS